jgi:hypothetical protein
MSEPHRVPIHLFACPSPTELEQARERLARESCPRRYCWYWRTLSFDWDLNPGQGCEVAERHFARLQLERRQGVEFQPWQQCCRASGNPQHPDLYEPNEPHLEADGWPVDFFQMVGKAARQRRFERRRRGKKRRENG